MLPTKEGSSDGLAVSAPRTVFWVKEGVVLPKLKPKLHQSMLCSKAQNADPATPLSPNCQAVSPLACAAVALEISRMLV
jgi:hypothetical protein